MRPSLVLLRAFAVVCCSVVAALPARAQFSSTCAAAPTVTAGVHAFDLRTVPIDEPTLSFCSFGTPDYDQWTRFVPAADGVVLITLESVQNGEAWVGVFNACGEFSVACASSAPGCPTIKLPATAGTALIIQVLGVESGRPFGSIRIEANPPTVGGDGCTDAVSPIGLGVTTYDGKGSIDNLPPGGGTGFDDVWFVHVPAASGGLMASVCGQSGAGDSVGLFSTCAPEGVLDFGNPNDDDFAYPPCRAAAYVEAGVPVYIRLAQACPRTAQFTLSFIPNVRPSNDDCGNATIVTEGRTTLDNTYATSDGFDACGGGGFGFNGGRDVWFRFTPPVSALFDIANEDRTGLAVPFAGGAALELYETCGGFALACDNNGFSSNYFRVALSGGISYVIRVAGTGRLQDGTPYGRGQTYLDIRRVVPPVNDVCAQAQVVGAGEFAFNLQDAQPDGARFCPTAPPIADVWFRYTPTTSGPAEVGLVSEEGLGIQSGEVTISGTCDAFPAQVSAFAIDPATGGYLSRLVFNATAGQPVLVRVGSDVPHPAPRNGRLYVGPVRAPAPPSNDTCEGATLISAGTTSFSLSTATLTAGPCYDESDCATDVCTTAIQSDIFFRFVSPISGTATLSVDDGEVYPFGGAVMAILDACSTRPTRCALECGDAPLDSFSFPVVAGQSSIIRIGAYPGQWQTLGGTLTLSLPCRADINGSGSVTVQDIFDFLAAYFSNLPSADFNGVGGVTVQDIFDFLAAYFTGCN